MGVVLCILLIGVLGCSGIVRYDPGYHEVHKETVLAESIEDKQDGFSNEIQKPVVDEKDDALDNTKKNATAR